MVKPRRNAAVGPYLSHLLLLTSSELAEVVLRKWRRKFDQRSHSSLTVSDLEQRGQSSRAGARARAPEYLPWASLQRIDRQAYEQRSPPQNSPGLNCRPSLKPLLRARFTAGHPASQRAEDELGTRNTKAHLLSLNGNLRLGCEAGKRFRKRVAQRFI